MNGRPDPPLSEREIPPLSEREMKAVAGIVSAVASLTKAEALRAVGVSLVYVERQLS